MIGRFVRAAQEPENKQVALKRTYISGIFTYLGQNNYLAYNEYTLRAVQRKLMRY